jgi:putative ATP-binding cassette transporter
MSSAVAFALRAAGGAGMAIAALGLLGAAFNAGLIAVVHRALASPEAGFGLAPPFVALGLGKALTAYVSGRVVDAYSQRSIAALRRDLVSKLQAVSYRRFEQLGAARVYAALTSDVATVHGALQASANGVVNLAVLLGGAAYLLSLDRRVFAALLLLALAGLAVHRAIGEQARALLLRARAEHDRLFRHFQALIDGAKELKLHAGRRRALLHGPLRSAGEALHGYWLQGNARYLLAQAVSGLLVLAVIGGVLFAFAAEPASGAGGDTASGYVLVALYLTGPLSSVLRLLPLFTAAEIALQRIREAGVQLDAADPEPSADPDARASFTHIELRAVSHRYAEPAWGGRAAAGDPADIEPGAGFALGPLSLRLSPGEIVFVTGGNGSGKSTLAKLLTGLYEPSGGELSWDGRPVTAANRDAYRQLFSAVFSEFHVFDELYGLPRTDIDARAQALLAELGLSRVVRIEGGVLSSVDLSRGQRKRLALLTALLEDRPVYVFDEWAADQDPEFKQVFYRRLLPQLKERGKAVVAITHDDRWFEVADRTIELRDGRIA